MSPPLFFPSEDALRVTIAAALVPPDVLASPARAWSDAEGALWIEPSQPIAPAALKKLAAAGVEARSAARGATARPLSCWAEIVRVRPALDPEAGRGLVLFLAQSPGAMLEAAAEMLRLGCDRQAYAAADGAWLLKVGTPPYYTLARALERGGELRAFAPSPPGQTRVWTEVGYGHPLAPAIRADAESLLLIGADGGWTTLREGSWTEIDHALEIAAPAATTRLDQAPLPARVRVTLRLASSGRGLTPALWVLREDAAAQMERMVASVPDEVLDDLLFASAVDPGEPGRTVVVLRARAGARRHVEPSVRAEAYAQHLSIGNLFVPCDATIEPPLRRDLVRELLAPGADEVTWLRPSGSLGVFQPERVSESAFQPLRAWVDYVVDQDAALLQEWVRGATFDFEAFEAAESTSGPSSRRRGREEEPERPQPKTRASAEPERPQRATKTRRAAGDALPEVAPVVLAVREDAPGPLAKELDALERTLLELDAPLDDPRRGELWERVADLNARLARPREAGLCWTRAIWELDPDTPAAARLASSWARSERGMGAADDTRSLALTSPSRDEVRALVSSVVATVSAGAQVADAAAVARWLDKHDEVLDTRSLWLGRAALSRLAGGDRLTMARARDRILSRLHRGLSVERDVPSFLRFASMRGGQGAATDCLREQLEKLLTHFEGTKRKQSPVEADGRLTSSYVFFGFGYGFARLGQVERARELVTRASSRLDQAEAVHGFLARAYTARVEQALEGLPPEAPLPAEVAAKLNELDRFQRYKVDRLRQFSAVLEPQEHLDPVVAYQRGDADPRGPEFAPLRGMHDVDALTREVERIVHRASSCPPDERARLLDGAMDFFPMLRAGDAAQLLEEVVGRISDVPPLRRARLLEEALMLAGHFGLERLVRTILGGLESILAGLGAEHAAEIAAVTGGALRTLRRVGLRDEAAALLDATVARAQGQGTPMLLARVHLAAGLAHLGRFDRARPSLEEALGVLGGKTLPMPERLELTRAVARALGQAPESFAVAALSELSKALATVTDSFNTNSHFCLSVVSFMESLVLGYASEDLALGELGRQWLDEDEYLIRRRIHRELSLP